MASALPGNLPDGGDSGGGGSGGEHHHHNDDNDHPDEPQDGRFECNICLDVAKDAVISLCGHLFCWPCLHTWIETRPQSPVCPVCKAGIHKDKVIPLYGRGGDNKDPREKAVPPRPRGQRPEPEPHPGAGAGFFSPLGNNFQMSFTFGALPFGFLNFNLGQGIAAGPPQPGPVPGAMQEEHMLNSVFLFLAGIFIMWLLIT